jgi:hypothetical protein
MKTKKTKDSYEAAYYMMYGAQVTGVKKRIISKGERLKKHYLHEWIITVEKIPHFAILGWNAGIVYGDIQQFKKMRLKLKKIIDNY